MYLLLNLEISREERQHLEIPASDPFSCYRMAVKLSESLAAAADFQGKVCNMQEEEHRTRQKVKKH